MGNIKERSAKTTKMVQLALLIAVIVLMGFTPIGYIKTPFIEITLIVVPVAVGAVLLGPAAGAILGLTFGITSFIQSFSSPLGAVMLDINPIFRVINCIVPRILCGWLTGLTYVGLKRIKPMQKLSVILANLACPLYNTIFFMTSMVLLYYDTPYVQNIVVENNIPNPFIFVIAFVGVNGLIEAVTCFVVGSAVTKALQVALKVSK